MSVQAINPANGRPLRREGEQLVDDAGNAYPIVAGVPRVCDASNYTASFGKQWNLFAETQIDKPEAELTLSEQRFFLATGWSPESLDGLDVLEAGSGAGRFSHVVLSRTRANLYSIDYSAAVEANWRNNGGIAPDRFQLFQASIYEMPFPANSFDRVFCMGVLQHTPDFEKSVHALIEKAKPGAEIVVDFYAIKGWWTKLQAKYMLRPITKRMSHERLLRMIERNAGWLIGASNLLDRVKLSPLKRFLPVVDFKGTFPPGLSREALREWVVLDTFDMFSPAFDNPQRIAAVADMFRRGGADVTFAGLVPIGPGKSPVVRGVKRAVA